MVDMEYFFKFFRWLCISKFLTLKLAFVHRYKKLHYFSKRSYVSMHYKWMYAVEILDRIEVYIQYILDK